MPPLSLVHGGRGSRASAGFARFGRGSVKPRPAFPGVVTRVKNMPHATILYAEDNRVLRLALKDLFALQGWCVEPCEDGLSALQKIEGREHYALLLFDNQLPGANGLELTHRARALAHRRDTPIVIFSASEIGTEARRAGADAFLKKPDDLGKVVETITRLLARNKDAEFG